MVYMRFVSFLIVSFSAIAFGASKSSANSMINNKASGYVRGSIVMQAGDSSAAEVNVGAIIGENMRNNRVRAFVDGDIVVTSPKDTVIDIGVVRGKKK